MRCYQTVVESSRSGSPTLWLSILCQLKPFKFGKINVLDVGKAVWWGALGQPKLSHRKWLHHSHFYNETVSCLRAGPRLPHTGVTVSCPSAWCTGDAQKKKGRLVMQQNLLCLSPPLSLWRRPPACWPRVPWLPHTGVLRVSVVPGITWISQCPPFWGDSQLLVEFWAVVDSNSVANYRNHYSDPRRLNRQSHAQVYPEKPSSCQAVS